MSQSTTVMPCHTVRLQRLSLGLLCLSVVCAQQVKVSTSRGVVYGSHVDYGSDASQLYFGSGDAFLGIPYARPPLGHLRFERTRAMPKFPHGEHHALNYSKACPQGVIFDEETMSEDCLTLNVFTPTGSTQMKLPVMVYIHGGGFIAGNAHDLDMPAAITNFVSRDVIVVTVQYRLGVLGFFTTHTDDFPANRGLHDSATALRWVYDEIEAFGGDRSQITLFGESAGSCSVAALTLSPMTKGLLSKAIMQSGGSLTLYDGYTSHDLANRSEALAMAVCNMTETEWEGKRFGRLKQCLQDATMYSILDSDDQYAKNLTDLGVWSLTVDDTVLPDLPQNLAKERPNIPVIMGTTRDEFYPFLVKWRREESKVPEIFNSSVYKSVFNEMAGNLTQDAHLRETVFELVQAIYVNHSVPSLKEVEPDRWLRAAYDTLGGLYFYGPTAREAEWYRNNNNTNVYLYQYEYESNVLHTDHVGKWKPVIHSEENCLLFLQKECWEAAQMENRTMAMDHVMASRMARMWTEFAKTGKPSPGWEPFNDNDSFKYYAISAEPSMKQSYADKHRYAWNDLVMPLTDRATRRKFNALGSSGTCSRLSHRD